jgi:hypothetical protein
MDCVSDQVENNCCAISVPISVLKKTVRKKRRVVPKPLTILRRLHFLNDSRTKYVSVGLHVESNFEAFIEIGKVSGGSVFLNQDEWSNILGLLDSEDEGYLKRQLMINGILTISVKKLFDNLHFCISFGNCTLRLNMNEMKKLRLYRDHLTYLLFNYDKSFNGINHYVSCMQNNADFIDLYNTSSCIDFESLYFEINNL